MPSILRKIAIKIKGKKKSEVTGAFGHHADLFCNVKFLFKGSGGGKGGVSYKVTMQLCLSQK